MTGIKLNNPLLLVALGGILTACMVCGIAATAVALTRPEPTPTAIIEPTGSGVPTSTPLPVAPTITPVPTIVIEPTPDVRVARYVASLNEPIDQMVDGASSVSLRYCRIRLARQPGEPICDTPRRR